MLLSPVMRSDNRFAVKVQAAVHLLSYGVGPLMLVQLACYPLLLLTFDSHWFPWQLADASVLVIAIGASPWIGFMVAQTRRGDRGGQAYHRFSARSSARECR